jgi:hypothetical protein
MDRSMRADGRRLPIVCSKYAPGVTRRCVHFLPYGGCARPDEFMCIEWLRANGITPLPSSADAAVARESSTSRSTEIAR